MTPSMKYSTYPILLGAALTLTGCLGGSSNNDDAKNKGASVPANAITITAANAEATVASAIAKKGMVSALGTVSVPSLTLGEALELVKKIRKSSSAIPATAIGVTDTQNCTGGGKVTVTSTVSGNTDSGSVKFENCIEEGFTFNGTLSYSDTYDPSTTVYSETTSGNLSATGSDATISFNGFDFAANGNSTTAHYTVTKFTFALDFTANGSAGGGFLVELTAPIVESTGDSCPESGAIKITGANSTTAELIYNGNGTTTIKANGVVVKASAACYA